MKEAMEFVKRKMRPLMRAVDYRDKRRAAGFNDEEKYIPDGTPLAPPIGYKAQPTMVQIIRDMVRSEQLARDLEEAGVETFEEADDFDVGDDGPEMHSPYENDFDPPVTELLKAGKEEIDRKKASKKPEKPAETGEAPEGAE